MRTRWVSMNIMYQIFVCTTQLIKSSTEASEVYSTTDCAAADLQLVVFVTSHNCIHIRFGLVHGLNFELRGSCRVVFSSALSAACITCQSPVLYFNHTAHSFVRKETSEARAL